MEVFSGECFDATEVSRLISMTGTVTAKKSLVDRVRERVRSGICLVCESPSARRGLCTRHYQVFQRKLRSLPRSSRAGFEIKLIKEGKILAVNQVREIMADNPFEVD